MASIDVSKLSLAEKDKLLADLLSSKATGGLPADKNAEIVYDPDNDILSVRIRMRAGGDKPMNSKKYGVYGKYISVREGRVYFKFRDDKSLEIVDNSRDADYGFAWPAVWQYIGK